MKNFFKMNIKDKHNFILYNNNKGKLYDKNLQHINKGMRFRELYEEEASYAEAQARVWKAEQENRKIINDREHINAALYESTSNVFKPLTKNQDNSLIEEKEIVKQLKNLTAIKEELQINKPTKRT